MKILAIALLSLVVTGCTSTEKSAYNTVVAAKAFTDKIAQANPQCSGKTVDPTKLCVYLRTAVSAKDLLIDAIEVYCAGPNFNGGGSCDPPDKGSPAYAQANQKLQAAIQGYGQAEKDLKGVIH